MRHNRRAVMAERYKLYMRKHIFNGRYFVRNLQIFVCVIVITALVIGGVTLGHSGSDDVVEANATVSMKDALFGNSGEEKSAAKADTSEKNTEKVTEENVTTEAAKTETVVAEKEVSVVPETPVPEEQGEFANKCIANVEETLNIRKEPSTEAEFVGSMNPGAIAVVEGTEGDWTKIKSGDVEGYVLSQYVLTGDSAEEFAADYVTLRGTVLEDGVNIRSEKSTSADILVVLDKDDTVTVLENPENEAGDTEKVEKNDTKEQVVSTTEEVKSTVEETTADTASETEDNADAAAVTKEKATEVTTERSADSGSKEKAATVKKQSSEEINWVPVMLEDGQTGYIAADFVEVDELYEIAVSAEELERQAAEEAARKAAEEEAARQAAASQSSGNSNSNSGGSSESNDNSDSYSGATTTPVTTTESGECIGTFTITAYCGCKKCSGGSGKTASGTTPTEGRTIAADTSILPFGTQVVIDGVVYTVEDRGSGVTGNHIDIFFATHKKAMAFGKKTMKVYKY